MRNNIAKHIKTLFLFLLMMFLGGIDALGQDYSGTYYIASNYIKDKVNQYDVNNPANNYYLCPTEGWCYYQATDDFTGTDNGMPFLTTYKCRTADYNSGDPSDAVWYVEKDPNSSYYYIRQASTGRYLTSNGTIRTTNNADRMRIHLEAVAPEDLGDKQLFTIAAYSTYLTISPKGVVGGADDRNWLTVNGGNKNHLTGQSGKGDGPTGYKNTAGIIGIYTQVDANAPFYLEPAAVSKPTITNNFDGTFTITAAEGAAIYYTTDGSTPTTETTTTGTTSVNVTQTESMTVIKAIAKAASDAFPSVVTTYTIPQCARPVIKVSGGTVTITCATAGATIYYTKDGTPATTSSTPYTVPFAKGDATTIRAIATSPGYIKSAEAVFLPPTEVSSSSQITDMNGNYILASDFSSSSSIGTSNNPFKGTIDGGLNTLTLGHSLVAYAEDATIKNVILKDVSLSGGTNVGAICNEATGETRIYNCGVLSGSVGGSDKVGGIVGLLDGSSRVINCFNYADITSGSDCGGIVGYNNVASTSGNLKTMVMNCMFYGNITGGNAAPIYGGAIIHNKYASADNTGLNNYCYFLYDEDKNPYVKTIADDKYHGALGAEERYLNRFEFFRMTLNSTRNLAAYYVTGDATKKEEMAKWVLDKSIAPYPILKVQDKYPSVVNPDAEHATAQTERNKGGLLGTLSVTIGGTGSGAQFSAPTGASITKGSLTLNITDKDYDNFNYNYKKVQLPYYNDVGSGNYTGGRVVTGWKITSITGGTPGSFSTDTYDYPSFNFVDRKCTNKDLYSVSGRVFAQGAYWEVPDGVTAIKIEPYWAKAVYLSDANYDVTYTVTVSGSTATVNKYNVTACGTCPTTYNEQTVYTDLSTAITKLGSNASHKVYDYAVVLVGNYHQANQNTLVSNGKPITFMSADLDGDNEPDNTLFYYHNQRKRVSPIRFDFLNIPGIGMVKRTHDASTAPEPGIFKPQGWFEITNTVLIHCGQFEYAGGTSGLDKTMMAPLILQGGIYEQFVSGMQADTQNTNYILIGGNAWFKNFANGCHTRTANKTPKVPINVAGGDYTNFYLTGIYQPDANEDAANAECYIDGGRFSEVAGAGMQQVKGDVTWFINAADITSFFGGGINAAQPITGSISTTISNSYVDEFYGGPKFGDMVEGKNVTTNATDCHFGKFFGAGYGGTAFNRVGYVDDSNANNTRGWSGYVNTNYNRAYSADNGGISTSYDYEFIPHSDGNQTVARFFVNYASLSLASTRDVTNSLSGCTVGTFYGGGSLGAVNGDVNSTLTNCTVTGNAFGAGFSASVPTVEVWNTGAYLSPNPTYNRTANVFNNASVKTPKDNGNYVVYTWSNAYGSTSSPFTDTDDGKHYIHTNQPLDNLGTVAGNVTLNIEGSTTVGGSVYGGGEESGVDGSTEVNVTGGTIGTEGNGGVEYGNVYGGGKGKDDDAMAGLVKGTSTVTISGLPRIYHNVYGGGAYGSVGTFTYDNTTGIPTALAKEGTGVCNVTIKGGTFGWNGKENGMVFGSSRGDVGEPGGITDKQAWVYSTHVTIGDATAETSPTIKGSVYGSGENGHTLQNTVVDIKKGTIGIATGETITDNNGTPGDTSDDKTYSGADYPYRGNVYGGGCGTDTYWIDANNNETVDDGEKHYNPLAGIVRGNATVTMTGGHVVRNVYGAGAMGSVGTDGVETTGKTTVTISGGRIGVTGEGEGSGNGYVFGAARGESGLDNSYANVRETEVNINYATTPASDNEGKTEQLIAGSVFGGGEAGTVKESVTVNMTSGLILHDIYGGGALADTQTSNWDATKNENAGGWADGKTSASSKTTVNLIGGIVADQVFGGALGAAGKPAYVYGDVLVELNNNNNGETADGTKKGCAVREIFACNNIYGTPKGNATVHIYATQHRGKSQIANADAIGTEGQEGYKPAVTDAKVEGTYDVENVYGGGNQAAYNPASPYTAENTTGAKTQVIIEGCGLSSIKTVYGGGNAAAVPETNVTIKSAYEIQSVFGGGNGKDEIAPGVENPGADVGTLDQGGTTYGTGNANTTLEGGIIHEVYGGSNQKGIIKGSINQTTDPGASDCDLEMSKVVGAGKYADIDGDVNMVLSCQPTSKIDMLFAGADEANVNGNITLTITNGNFGKVFGGNNLGGTIKGKIVVNVKETGCQPINIDELYLGGNQAAYSVFGYYDSGVPHEVTGKNILKPRTSATDENLPVKHDGTKYDAISDFTNYDQPILNVISCTRIGKVFGGGYGSGAVMYADPTVNINMIPGKYADRIDRDGTAGADNDANALGELVDVFGGGNEATVIGNPVINIGSETTVDNSPVLGAYITGSVYGGGNKANVDGNTYVNISTKMTTVSTDYTYAAVDHSVTENYQGISIGASAYGGGCEADVLGNTHVQMSDGYVFNGIFGGGYSGSVGTVTERELVNYDGTTHTSHEGCVGGKPKAFEENTGKCTVVVTGGQIGPIEVATQGMNRPVADGGPVPEGWVWGGGCGVVADPATDSDADFRTYVKETDVTIGGTAFILESIIGGGEFGRVLGDTHVTIQDHCQIGVGEGKVDSNNKPIRYTDEQWTAAANAVTSGDASAIATAAAAMPPCSHYDYGKKVGDKMVYDTYDPYYDKYYGNSSSVPADFANGSTSAPSDGKTWIGCVFGGGSGYMPYEKSDKSGYGWLRSAGVVEGNTLVEIKGGHILTNVYGGNEVTDVKGNCTVKMTDGTVGVPRTLDQIKANPLNGNIFGAGKGDPRTYFNTFTNVGSTKVEVTGGIVYGSVYGGGEDGHVTGNAKTTISKETGEGKKAPVIGCDGTAGNNGNVFGGGKGSATALTAGVVGGNVTLDILDGHIKGSVYGGGEIASVGTYFTNATDPNYGKMQKGDTHGCLDVNMKGGTIHQNVYGGCMGTTENDLLGVSKNVTVDLNEDVADNAKGCVVKGSIFGCNNVNSSPEGTVTVHIHKTQRDGQTRITNDGGVTTAKVAGTKDSNGEYVLSSFDVQAVYGGGNLAAYEPSATLETGTDAEKEASKPAATVIIDGCERTSIGHVYGGGNAASTPATNVTVNGTFEIGELFGGGNGKDDVVKDGVTKPNPGANVGYKDYSEYYQEGDEWKVRDNTDADTKAKRMESSYRYGTGKAAVNIFGGTVHRVFGGSNTKGNVRQTAVTLLDEHRECEFNVDEAYGGGKSAEMDAEARLLMACIPGLTAAYGGAEAADVHGNVTLNITNGTFDRIFGGNNIRGTINGSITVNVEEVGCRPVKIGELYGGGNLAGYSVNGYNDDGTPKESGPKLYEDPQVNVMSFTSIGNIYGGGYGSGATMVGNPTVNINEVYGRYYNDDKSIVDEDAKTPNNYPIPSHALGKMGAINNVFGGGNAAKVIGSTTVNIGTLKEVYIVKQVTSTTLPDGCYIRSGEGTTTSPFVYSPVSGTASADVTYYEKKTVLGVDIRGNVYGGGNNAEVTGNTNVNIGKRSDQ